MFDRFWQQYPQGSILSELLQIHGEIYIVRVTIKSAEQILVSTLAAADRLEVAESTAHRQALEMLGCTTTTEPTVLSTATLVDSVPDVIVSAAPATPITPPSIPVTMSPVEVEAAPLFDSPQRATTVAEPAAPQSIVVNELNPMESEPLLVSAELPLMTAPTKSRTKKAPASEPIAETSVPESLAPAITEEIPLTVTDMIPLINMELKRLNWSKEQGRDYMVTLYNKRASALLSDEELFGLLQHLKAEPGLA